MTPLDVIENIRSGLGSRQVMLAIHAFAFEYTKEALHHRVVPDVARLTGA